MDSAAVLKLLREEHRSLAWPGERIDVLPYVTRKTTDDKWHCILFSDLTAANADDVIAEQIEHHRAQNAEFEWKLFGYDMPPDLMDRLGRHGFEIGPREAVVVYDLAAGIKPFETPTDCVVERITHPRQIDDFRSVAEAVFGKEYSRTSAELERGIAEGSMQHLGYLGAVGGEPASVGRLYTNPQSAFGGLYGGGTLERFRSRGCYRAVIAARARDAVEFGACYLLVDALPTSLPILLRLGFVHLTDTWPCVWSPS